MDAIAAGQKRQAGGSWGWCRPPVDGRPRESGPHPAPGPHLTPRTEWARRLQPSLPWQRWPPPLSLPKKPPCWSGREEDKRAGAPLAEGVWLEPFPDEWPEKAQEGPPEARYARRESLE